MKRSVLRVCRDCTVWAEEESVAAVKGGGLFVKWSEVLGQEDQTVEAVS